MTRIRVGIAGERSQEIVIDRPFPICQCGPNRYFL